MRYLLLPLVALALYAALCAAVVNDRDTLYSSRRSAQTPHGTKGRFGLGVGTQGNTNVPQPAEEPFHHANEPGFLARMKKEKRQSLPSLPNAPTFPFSFTELPTLVVKGVEVFIQVVQRVGEIFAPDGDQPTAKAKTGTYLGVQAPVLFGQQWWLGVPFAQAPTGDLRFRAAKALPDSDAQYNATAIKPTCWQPNGYLLNFNGDDGQRNEDCLYLNIYTPKGQEKKSEKLPVMVWFFGGGEIGGAASTYNSTLLELESQLFGEPIIIVTPQYRLNAFGFMSGKPYADAANAGTVDLNPGLTDVTMAIDWVHDNIEAFGGDPDKVTIAGQSSGAFNVGAQLLKDGKPGAPAPNYRSAVMLSGTMGSEPAFPADGAIVTKTFDRVANAVGCGSGDQIACLKAADPMALAEATFPDVVAGGRPDDATIQGPDYYPGVFYYQPVSDGVYHRDSAAAQVQRGEMPDVPILLGNVKDEGTIFVDHDTTADGWRAWLASVSFQEQKEATAEQTAFIDKVAAAYPEGASVGAPYWPARTSNVSRFGAGSQFERSASASGDLGWQASRRLFLNSFNTHKKSNIYAYLFNQTDSAPNVEDWTGIPHGFDPTYWFAGYAFVPNLLYPAQPATSRDTSLSLINFVTKQDPNHFGMLNWPPYTQDNKKLFRFQGFNNKLIDDDFRPEMSVFMDPANLALTYR